jgi:hypothetical protein
MGVELEAVPLDRGHPSRGGPRDEGQCRREGRAERELLAARGARARLAAAAADLSAQDADDHGHRGADPEELGAEVDEVLKEEHGETDPRAGGGRALAEADVGGTQDPSERGHHRERERNAPLGRPLDDEVLRVSEHRVLPRGWGVGGERRGERPPVRRRTTSGPRSWASPTQGS